MSLSCEHGVILGEGCTGCASEVKQAKVNVPGQVGWSIPVDPECPACGLDCGVRRCNPRQENICCEDCPEQNRYILEGKTT